MILGYRSESSRSLYPQTHPETGVRSQNGVSYGKIHAGVRRMDMPDHARGTVHQELLQLTVRVGFPDLVKDTFHG